MSAVPRYFLPEHPELTDVYSKAELRGMLQAGRLSRSDMVTDDETGIAHLLGDLLAMPFPDAGLMPARRTSSLQPAPAPRTHEFRADTPLPRTEHAEEEEREDEGTDADEEGDDEGEEQEEELISENDEEVTDYGEEEEEEQEQEGRPMELAGRTRVREEPELVMEDEDEEEVWLYVGHPSWLAFPRALLVAAVCIGSAIYFQQHRVGLEWITLLGSIAGLVILFIALDRATTTYFVTSKRVEIEFGIIGRSTKEVRICDIRAIDVLQKGFDAVAGLGTVRFDSSASSGPEVCFKNVRRPHAIKKLVRELQG